VPPWGPNLSQRQKMATAARPSVDEVPEVPKLSDDGVHLVAGDPSWPDRFRAEARQLEKAALPGLVTIEHIGSTAVPELSAKPIIDIAVAVDIPARTPRLIRAIESLGYRYLGTYGLRGRYFFRKGSPATVHLHLVNQRSPHLDAWLDFRDALRTDPEAFSRYDEEKKRLARLYTHDRAAYTAGKGPVVAEILAAARRKKSRRR
jgi:GrpB-like predicted nucleotidyltransferase (UPF0157 family)